MKKTLILGAAIALIGSGALAGTNLPPSAGPSTASPQTGVTDDIAPERRPGQRWREWARHHHDRDMMRMRGRPDWGPPGRGQQSHAAHFVFENGRGARIDIKCAENDTTEACAQAVGGLIDRILTVMQPDTRSQPGAPPAKNQNQNKNQNNNRNQNQNQNQDQDQNQSR